jgi:hypothetical protein
MGVRDDNSQRSSQLDRSHEEMRALLPSYATAMALGQAPEGYYSTVAAHLQTCAACRADLEELLELVVPTYRGQLIPAANNSQVDLSFLRSSAPQAVESRPSWFVDSLHRLVVEFSDALLGSMRQSAFAQAARGAALYHYAPVPAPPNNLGITIDVFASDSDPAVGNVQVLLDIPSRDPFDQSGTVVTLRVGDRVWEGSTSATGSVTFTDVPLERLSQLRVEISLPVG